MSNEKKQTIEPGAHKVKVRNWGLRETNNGNMQVYIGFSNGATFFQMVGTNDIGDEIVARSLTLCGFTGKDLPDLFDDNALNKNKEIEIFVKYTPDEQSGEPRMQVYVNDPGKQMKGALDKKGALSKLKELKINLKKDFKAARSDIEMPDEDEGEPDTKMNETQSNFDADDIPF